MHTLPVQTPIDTTPHAFSEIRIGDAFYLMQPDLEEDEGRIWIKTEPGEDTGCGHCPEGQGSMNAREDDTQNVAHMCPDALVIVLIRW